MNLDANLASWLRLTLVQGLGNQSLLRLLEAIGLPEKILASSFSDLSSLVKPAIAHGIIQAQDFNLDGVSSWLSVPGNSIITLDDPSFPRALLITPDPPAVLYIKGNVDLLNKPAIAVIGSRNPSSQGMRNARDFALSLSDSGLCIVSGMALGIDTAAHEGGLSGASSSIAVVGTGLDRVYPARNRDLAHDLSSRGCIISEFPLGTPPISSNFPRRNRIISGLSLGCLVVEASLQSGSLITARFALEQNREVFAIPGSIHSPQAKGCHSLIKQGAKLVESTNDILSELGFSRVTPSAVCNANHNIPLLEIIPFEPISVDTIVYLSNLTIAEVSAILLQLEVEGHIASLPGNFYQRIV